MRRSYAITIFIATMLLVTCVTRSAHAQAFRKGSLLISVSEGGTFANYTTSSMDQPFKDVITRQIAGDRDPLCIEYGLSDRWGISLTAGGDIYKVNPTTLYNIQTTETTVKATTGELTVDANYHFYVRKRVDLSGFGSLGLGGISIKGNTSERPYQYSAGGGIIRIGAKARYYVLRRFGLMGMLSTFTTGLSTEGAKDNTIAHDVTTSITGYALEFGLCYRVLR